MKTIVNMFFRIIFVAFILWANLVYAANDQVQTSTTTTTTTDSSSSSSQSQAPQIAPNVSLSPSSQDKEGISKFFEKSNFQDFAEQPEAKPFVIPGGKKYEH
jgi:cytoskeletal protein RodZ